MANTTYTIKFRHLEKQIEEISREQRKLSRIRRVYRDIRKIDGGRRRDRSLGRGHITSRERPLSSLDAAEQNSWKPPRASRP